MNKNIKLFIICLIIGFLAPMTIFGAAFYTRNPQEIQLYSTYYVFNPFQIALVTVGPTLFLSFLILGILTKFKERLTWIFFCLGTIITGLVGVQIYNMMNSL